MSKLRDLLECTDDQGLSMGQLMRALDFSYTVADIQEGLKEVGAEEIRYSTRNGYGPEITAYRLSA